MFEKQFLEWVTSWTHVAVSGWWLSFKRVIQSLEVEVVSWRLKTPSKNFYGGSIEPLKSLKQP